MKLTHYGHACVLVEFEDGRRALFDPGTYSAGFEECADLDLVLITHAHPDHLDTTRLQALLELSPDAVVVTNSEVGDSLQLGPRDVVVDGTSVFGVAGFRVQPTGAEHAVIHPDLPQTANTGFILDESVWHPGDAFDATPSHVDVLLLPVGGPFMKIADAIDFARAVKPRVIVPIHQAGLADKHRQLHYQLIKNLVDSKIQVLPEGHAQEV